MISRPRILALLLPLLLVLGACTSEDAPPTPATDDGSGPPAAVATVVLLVRDTSGDLLQNALVEPLGVLTDGDGRAELTVDAGTDLVVRVGKDGYASQIASVRANGSVVVPTALIRRTDPVRLGDAAAGGTAVGPRGVRVILPPGALVDGAGQAVSGAVDVFLTPVDITNDREKGAFPGRYEGIDAAGEETGLLSYGCADLTFEQDGEELDLAPGQTATIEIPIFVTEQPDGTPIAAGDAIPLWSLDEATGLWRFEETGTVVASAGSPTGFALRGSATHFSWWNCDLTWPFLIWPVEFKFPENVPLGDVLLVADVTAGNGNGPRNNASDIYEAGVENFVLLPSAIDVVLTATAYDGFLRGQTTVVPGDTSDTRDVIVIEMVPRVGPFLPGERLRGFIAQPDEVHVYTFEGLAGETFVFGLDAVEGFESPPGPSGTLSGEVVLVDPDGIEIARAAFDADTTAGLAQELPADGTYRVEITGRNAPGWYLATTRIRPAVPGFSGGVVYLANGNLFWDGDADGPTDPVQVNPPLDGVGDIVEDFAVAPGSGILYTYKDRSFAPELFLVEKPGQAIKVSDEADTPFGSLGIETFKASRADPTRVVYVVRGADNSNQLYGIDTDDPGNSVQLGEGGFSPQFVPGGSRVVYVTKIDPDPFVRGSRSFVIDFDGDNETPLHDQSEIEGGRISVSPDGSNVLYTVTDFLTKSDLYLGSIPPGTPVRLNDPAVHPDVDSHKFLKDGRVLYEAGGNLYLVDPASPATKTLVNGGGPGRIDAYVISPDGDKVAYATPGAVYVVDLADPDLATTLGNLGGQVSHSLAFTPDGASILVVKENADRHRELHQVKLATPTDQILLTPAFSGFAEGVTQLPDGASFRFSADGGTVYFIADLQADEQFDLFLVSLDNPGDAVQVNPAPGGDVSDVQVAKEAG